MVDNRQPRQGRGRLEEAEGAGAPKLAATHEEHHALLRSGQHAADDEKDGRFLPGGCAAEGQGAQADGGLHLCLYEVESKHEGPREGHGGTPRAYRGGSHGRRHDDLHDVSGRRRPFSCSEAHDAEFILGSNSISYPAKSFGSQPGDVQVCQTPMQERGHPPSGHDNPPLQIRPLAASPASGSHDAAHVKLDHNKVYPLYG